VSNNNSNNSINDNDPQSLTISELINNFPFTSQRHNQEKVLSEICNAFNSGCKYIILEAPTGFGKSPVAIAMRNIFKSKVLLKKL
jgi:ATP-dependent DNA helicase DinG